MVLERKVYFIFDQEYKRNFHLNQNRITFNRFIHFWDKIEIWKKFILFKIKFLLVLLEKENSPLSFKTIWMNFIFISKLYRFINLYFGYNQEYPSVYKVRKVQTF